MTIYTNCMKLARVACLLLSAVLITTVTWQLQIQASRIENPYRPAPTFRSVRLVSVSSLSSAPATDAAEPALAVALPLAQAEVPEPEPLPQYNIPLSLSLQEHTYQLCQQYGVGYTMVLAIMEHESRFIPDVKDNLNKNGTLDRGLMQINQVNWQWLAEEGIDINVPEENVEAGVLMLSRLLEKYDEEETLMAYQCGENRMMELSSRGYVTKFARDILSREFEPVPVAT